jgi:thiamine kinase-like enzyme
MSQLGKDIKNIALDILEKLEYKNHLCHFDYQPSHVVSYNKKYYIVDWIHAKLANPILDIASTYVILRLKSYKLAHQYVYKVIDLTDIKIDEIYNAIPLMAAVKMIETDDIFKHKVLTTLVFDPKNKEII